MSTPNRVGPIRGPEERPDHPDVDDIARIVFMHDERSDAGAEPDQILAELADTDSVLYVAGQRVLRMMMHGYLNRQATDAEIISWMSIWIDAFTAGARFQHDRHTSAKEGA